MEQYIGTGNLLYGTANIQVDKKKYTESHDYHRNLELCRENEKKKKKNTGQ